MMRRKINDGGIVGGKANRMITPNIFNTPGKPVIRKVSKGDILGGYMNQFITPNIFNTPGKPTIKKILFK